MAILFYSHTVGQYAAFSNFSPHPIELDGAVWPKVEHFFQAAKFPGSEHAEAIRAAKTPYLAKRLGRSRTAPFRPDWDEVRDDVMRRAVRQKFAGHPDLRALLLE